MVRRLVAGKFSYRGLDTNVLHNLGAAYFDQRFLQHLSRILDPLQNLDHNELEEMIGAMGVVRLAHMLLLDERVSQVQSA